MSQLSHIEKVAIAGATGRLGQVFAEELLKTGRHIITALTRIGSKGKSPDGTISIEVDYDDEEALATALEGQQFLVIALSTSTPPDTHTNLFKAAVKAGVSYIMPNAYGGDVTNDSLVKDDIFTQGNAAKLEEIQGLGGSYIAMTCGMWYEWCLALDVFFGINLKTKKATFFDDGTTPVNTSTWAQCGRALAALLSLPESGASPSVSDWRNKTLFISSFRVSQRDILNSVHRVVGTSDKDWEIIHESSEKSYSEGRDALAIGDRSGFPKALAARAFFPSADGDYETRRGISNKALGLPQENLDSSTKSVMDMVETGWDPFA